jgi:aminopeptidase N
MLVDSEDRLYQSILIQIPSLNIIAGNIGYDIDFDRIQDARNTLIEVILDRYMNQIQNLYRSLRGDLPKDEKTSSYEIGTRAYINSLLDILSYSQNTDEILQLAEIQYCESRTMTLRLGSLTIIDKVSTQDRHLYIQEFIDQFRNNSLVMMKYFAIVGSSSRDNIIERIKIAQQEPFYDKLLPNHAKSLFGSFARNLEFFHKKDGSGYSLLADFIIDIDPINPHTAARMSGSFKIFPKLNLESQDIMRPYLEKILRKE